MTTPDFLINKVRFRCGITQPNLKNVRKALTTKLMALQFYPL